MQYLELVYVYLPLGVPTTLNSPTLSFSSYILCCVVFTVFITVFFAHALILAPQTNTILFPYCLHECMVFLEILVTNIFFPRGFYVLHLSPKFLTQHVGLPIKLTHVYSMYPNSCIFNPPHPHHVYLLHVRYSLISKEGVLETLYSTLYSTRVTRILTL